MYQNGTLQGLPLCCAAALAVLDTLEQPGTYEAVFGDGPMWDFLFADAPPVNYADILRTDIRRPATLEVEMLRQGLFVLPNNRRFISITHTEDDLAQTFEAFNRACRTFKA